MVDIAPSNSQRPLNKTTVQTIVAFHIEFVTVLITATMRGYCAPLVGRCGNRWFEYLGAAYSYLRERRQAGSRKEYKPVFLDPQFFHNRYSLDKISTNATPAAGHGRFQHSVLWRMFLSHSLTLRVEKPKTEDKNLWLVLRENRYSISLQMKHSMETDSFLAINPNIHP